MPTFPSEARIRTKVFLWFLIAIYTFLLPNARIVYDAMVGAFGQDAAGKVPLVVVAIVGCMYAAVVMLTHKSLKKLLFLVPCGVIAYLIMRLVDNPNKHIHIPEYVLMAWLLFAVLSKEYHSKDIFILIFIYASILGVVDELEQGIYPARFYGWIDMVVNSASALIGVFTIMGLKTMKPVNWKWTSRLKEIKHLCWLCLFGITGAVIMCVILFRVQASGDFWGVYPVWLWIWNMLFLIITPVMIISSQGRLRKYRQKAADKRKYAIPPDMNIAQLWTIPMLVILFYMHSILLYLSISGVEFA